MYFDRFIYDIMLSEICKARSDEDNKKAPLHITADGVAFSLFLCYNIITDISTEFGGMIS